VLLVEAERARQLVRDALTAAGIEADFT